MKSKNALSTVLTLILILTIMGAVASAYDSCSIKSNLETQSAGDPLSNRIDDILAEDKSVFLFFYADWCPYCHQQMPIIDQLGEEYAEELVFIHINVTARPDHAEEFGVSALPTMIAISGRNGDEYVIEDISGFAKKAELVKMISPGAGSEPDYAGGVGITALAAKCNSCSDCTKKLNGDYGTVVLTTDLINVRGSCIIFGANNVVFDGGGHKIDGDGAGEFESGIAMTDKSGNTIRNCEITDFESGITLYSSSKNEIYDNEISSNYYDGIWISDSDSNSVYGNLIEDNGKYGVYFASDSNSNTFSENTVCSNPIDIHDSDKNSGDDNACDTTHNWNDAGTTGCTHDCTVKKPDLVITDVWNEDGTICYQIRNLGDVTAPSGHYAFLLINGIGVAGNPIDSELEPGERLKQCFKYGWQCSPPDDTVTVCADREEMVGETDEGNNCRKEVWKCDNTPPAIVSGPVVSEITQSSVTISWTTNEDSDSLVRFGRTAGKYEDQKSGLKMKQEHKILLTDLLPSTTYHYVVESTDASKNTVVSRDGVFETGPVPDDEPPVVHALDITRGKGDFLYYELSADVSDNIGVGRVEFYIDDRLIGTDYSEPYLYYLVPAYMEMTRDEFFTEHTVEAAVFDIGGMVFESSIPWGPPYEVMSVTAKILAPCCSHPHPYPGYLYTDDGAVPDGTTVDITVRATEYELGGERPGTPECPGDMPPPTREIIPHPVRRVEFYLDGTLIGTSTTPSSTDEKYIYTHTWDASGLGAGEYEIEARAIATDGTVDTATCTVTVAEGAPYVMPGRSVSRIGNYFEVTLTLSNPGTASARVDTITDHVVGFQAVGKSAEEYSVTTGYTTATKDCEILIDLFTDTTDTITLSPGEFFRVVYSVVPILYEGATDYSIGEETVISYYDPSGRLEERRITSPSSRTLEGEWFPSSVDNAIETSDYLIATNPARLFTQYTDADVEELLSSMAGLAEEKNGVLGYLDTYSRSTFKNLIEPGGDWSSRLATDWTSEGYLLIVGETDIVPSRDIFDTSIRDATSGWSGGSVYPVTCVDNTYADISGSDNLPELIVARIIGDSAGQLTTPIETSLLDQFERTDALVVSGTGGGQSSFETNADEVAGIVDDEFTVDLMHGGDYANDAARLAQFTTRARDKDVLFYRDHGSIGCWSHTICTWNFPVNFGNSYPFAFGSACSTGHFEGSYCIGEAFLDSGAGVYLGATESSGRSANNDAGKKFFNKWIDSPKSLGQAFKETKRELGTSNDYKRLWVLEYNLYGDPKYGSSALDSSDFSPATLSRETSLQPPSLLEVTVPDYEVTTRDRLDYVKIPDGQLLLVPDEPMVPYYATSVDYAMGYEVMDVVLTERSGLTTATGLNLPVASMDPGGDGSEKLETLSESTGSEWYPEEDYRWQIIENPDGSTTLLIIMYPFYYNPLTTDVEFYKNYKFEINYAASTIEIAALTTDKDVYPGDVILVNLWLNNSGDAQDVLVDAVVKAGSSGEVISGLLLHTLKDFTGLASFSPRWDSDGIEPGYYFVEVTLKDTSDNVLDRKTEMFRLGISSGEIVSFTATPECFDIGDEIEMEMAFKNNGTVKITGTAIIRVFNSTGGAVEEFRHNITDLTPSGSVSFSDTWDTSGTEEGSSYTIIGYVLYDSKSTDPATVTVRNMIMGDLNRDGVVTTADAAIALELAASGEWDPAADADCDGRVTSLDALMILQAAAGNIELEGGES